MKKRMVVLMASAAMMMLSGMTVSASENLDNVVDTSYGKVQGINSTDEGYENVVQFKGVPYAAPPVGDLRWKAPVDHEKWDDILVCDTNREMPMQELGFVEPSGTDFHNNTAPEMSEDCLYLNISTTEENLAGDEKKPVYVWFHGGGLTVGHTYSAEGNLDAFAENDVIAVSVEQRLGVFGYLSLPQLSEEQGQSGNYGLMDQIKALEWIKENIANFGGDPENITVGGQSGGTTKATSMIASPKMDVEVDKLVLESGLNYPGTFQSQEDAEKNGTAYLEDLGLSADISMEELRAMDGEELLKSASEHYPGRMNQDGLYVAYPSIQEAVNEGVFDDVSILSGANMGEGQYLQTPTADEFYAAYKEKLGDLYDKYDFENLLKVTDSTAMITSRQLGTLGFGSWSGANIMMNRLYGKLMTERTDGKAKNYTYLFSQVTPERITEIGTDRSAAQQWAWHSSEQFYVFNSMRDGVPASRDWRDWDYELAEKMNQYWVNFITNGDPNGEGLAQWPEADENMGYIDFGAGITVHSEPLAPLEELMGEFTQQYFQFPTQEQE